MSERVRCPRCGQDWLILVTVVDLELGGVLCPECEAFWPDPALIGSPREREYGVHWHDFWTFTRSKGLGDPSVRNGGLVVHGLFTRHQVSSG